MGGTGSLPEDVGAEAGTVPLTRYYPDMALRHEEKGAARAKGVQGVATIYRWMRSSRA